MKILVLCGGIGGEREVSLNSGAAVGKALIESGHDVIVKDATSMKAALAFTQEISPDCVFIALHGSWGEDGRLQAALDLMRVPYTGSGPLTCRQAMIKPLAKREFQKKGLRNPVSFLLNPGDDIRSFLNHYLDEKQRFVIKPACGGSTVGVSIVKTQAEAYRAITEVWEIEPSVLFETYIPGREITVAVMGSRRNCFALPVIEIRARSGFYDYGAKYLTGDTEYICPAELPEDVARGIMADACIAHMALGCDVYSRVDFRLDDSEDARAFVLEVNTAPGMTSTSLVPKAAAAYGWSFPQLVDRIVRDSMPPLP